WIGVASGVQHLHEHDPCLIHGDLKPTNVLIDENWNPVLCDFGLAAIFMEADLTTTSPHAGTERYLSPELILDDHPRTSVESDIYALGCIGLEFIFSLRPYHHRQNPPQGVIIKDILRGVQPATRPPGLDNFTDVIWDVIERCLCRDPSYRPAAADVLFWINTIISSMNILLAA
ncbi:kinase suppressor of Ras 2, partial [Serendipita sp. 399]